MPKQSLIQKVIDHLLNLLLGRKYWFVLMQYPNQRVRFDDATIPPVPLVETSSNIFFTRQQAYDYLHKFRQHEASDYIVTIEVHSFRSRYNIPAYSRYMEIERTEKGLPSRIV